MSLKLIVAMSCLLVTALVSLVLGAMMIAAVAVATATVVVVGGGGGGGGLMLSGVVVGTSGMLFLRIRPESKRDERGTVKDAGCDNLIGKKEL
jgi:hypothetical protein